MNTESSWFMICAIVIFRHMKIMMCDVSYSGAQTRAYTMEFQFAKTHITFQKFFSFTGLSAKGEQ